MRTLEQEVAEWRAIQEFTAERRRLWPGAKITLQPDSKVGAAARTPAGMSGSTKKD
jgi:hypothetical protein